MITRREAKEIVDWVVSEMHRRSFAYATDGKLDLGKGGYGGGTISGTPSVGGDIADGAIWDRHVHSNASVRGTKVRLATVEERGTVRLAYDLELSNGVAIQPTDSRIHNTTVSGATEHDARYFTQEVLLSGVLDGYYDSRYYTQTRINSEEGASLVGIEDSNEVFISDNVEDALYEIILRLGAQTVIDLFDTPDSYPTKWFPWHGNVLAVNRVGNELEWRPRDYIDGGGFTDTYEGITSSKRSYVDGGSFTGYELIDGGTF